MHNLLKTLYLQNQHSTIGIDKSKWSSLFLLYMTVDKTELFNHIIVCLNNSEAEDLFQTLKILNNEKYHTILFKELDTSIYDDIFKSESDYLDQITTINQIIKDQGHQKQCKKQIIITTHSNLSLNLPPISFFKKEIVFKKNGPRSIEKSVLELTNLGYKRVAFITSPCEFSVRGNILDIYLVGEKAVRIIFDIEKIEKISEIDSTNFKQLENSTLNEYTIPITPQAIFEDKAYIDSFKENVAQVIGRSTLHKKNLRDFLQCLKKCQPTPFFYKYFLLFFNSQSNLLDYFNKNKTFIIFLDYGKLIQENERIYYEQKKQEKNIIPNFFSLPSFDFFFKKKMFQTALDLFSCQFIENESFSKNQLLPLTHITKIRTENINLFLTRKTSKIVFKKNDLLEVFLNFIKSKSSYDYKVFACFKSPGLKKRLENALKEFNILKEFVFIETQILEGFVFLDFKTIIISETDFFQKHSPPTTEQTHNDIVSEDFSHLKIKDYVIHKEFGVGQYLGMVTIDKNNESSDFLLIEYSNQDKIYVPIYKADQIQKHPKTENPPKVDILGNTRFSELKTKTKKTIKQLAFNLIQLQAKRKMGKAYQFPPPDETYFEFSNTFEYTETQDQLKAINHVVDDLMKSTPMDRVICGDVGNGKTEVAMRAAFKVASEGKQVALLVPTTVLALQHYNNFKKRFSPFALNVEYLSRFVSPKKEKEIIKNVSNGTVDILIGTHKIFNKKINFKNLELLIIDEEHKFGVGHKEILKNYKTNIHTLTMTATPIPRTLQMSLLGIRDISLIKTAPVSRKPIDSYVIKFNELIIKKAIDFEFGRGGQVIFIHNKVNDIEEIFFKISKIVPYAKITFAHGQLNSKILEKRITDFYNGHYNTLISTAIIESGIDIPSANTIFINNSHCFGLSQLHQLKGRIGRSDKKGYAYFIIPENQPISELAYKRINVLQTHKGSGSGISVAMNDLEIRGPGDILGAEQSGHINNIGLELYLDLLKEAIDEMKGIVTDYNGSIDLQIPIHAKISENYIPTSQLRLKFYKTLSNTQTEDELKQTINDIIEIFGPPDQAFYNLVSILKIKILLKSLAVNSLKILKNRIRITFSIEYLTKNRPLQEKIFNFFFKNRDIYSLSHNNSVEIPYNYNNNIDEIVKLFENLLSSISRT